MHKRIASKVKTFEKVFDISEDAIFVLSEKREVLYANKALHSLFSLPENTLGKPFSPIPKIRIKKEWIPLDEFIHNIQSCQPGKMHSFPQSSLSINENMQSIPVNIYLDRFDTEGWHTEWCCIIVIQDLRKEYERSKVAYRHKLTNLPNQLQAKTDLNKIFSKIHLHNKKLALILIDIDNFSQIRALVGYTQSETMIIRFAQFLEYFAKENDFYIYHTFSNDFLLCLPRIESEEEVIDVMRQIQKEIGSLYKINSVPFHLTVSGGISIYPDSGSTRTLLDHAYKALSEAHKIGH